MLNISKEICFEAEWRNTFNRGFNLALALLHVIFGDRIELLMNLGSAMSIAQIVFLKSRAFGGYVRFIARILLRHLHKSSIRECGCEYPRHLLGADQIFLPGSAHHDFSEVFRVGIFNAGRVIHVCLHDGTLLDVFGLHDLLDLLHQELRGRLFHLYVLFLLMGSL